MEAELIKVAAEVLADVVAAKGGAHIILSRPEVNELLLTLCGVSSEPAARNQTRALIANCSLLIAHC